MITVPIKFPMCHKTFIFFINKIKQLTSAENREIAQLKCVNRLNQWSPRCTPVHTSVHENYFTVHRKICKMKNIFYNDINFVFF